MNTFNDRKGKSFYKKNTKLHSNHVYHHTHWFHQTEIYPTNTFRGPYSGLTRRPTLDRRSKKSHKNTHARSRRMFGFI
ncbi:hypothetical protein [Zooshikella sp. RANM57]|uniref:hypothetical protein n=1 Tax=Zooshikella sp. RANM57 TaxID=3425863 RepID=UPI003D6F1952